MSGSLNSDYSDDAAPMSEINVTPLVDVVLVLLIVFMITVPLMMSAAPIKVDLPPAATGDAATDKPPKSLEIFLRQEDSGEVAVMIGDQRVPEDLLDSALESMSLPDKSLPVHVAADRHLPYEKVIHVIDVLRGLGFEKVGLDTNPVPKKSK